MGISYRMRGVVPPDTINDTEIDWGTSTGQVSMDDIGDGSTNAAVTLTQETNWDNHLSATGASHSYINQAVLTTSSPTFANVVSSGGLSLGNAGWASNIGLATGGDTSQIKIQGAGAALSATNIGYVALPNATSGLLTIFSIIADVTIDLTGAHFGLGTFGNISDYPLSVYALNNNGSLVWGVSSVPNHTLFLDADDDTTATNITQVNHILVSGSLGADAQALEVGWFKANFNDTGDEWAIQTGDLDINLGPCPTIWKPYPLTIGAITAAPTKATTTLNDQAMWCREGGNIKGKYSYQHSNNTGAADGTADYTFPFPTGLLMDLTYIYEIAAADKTNGQYLGGGKVANTDAESTGVVRRAAATAFSTSAVRLQYQTTDDKSINVSSAALALSAGAIYLEFDYAGPITGWS